MPNPVFSLQLVKTLLPPLLLLLLPHGAAQHLKPPPWLQSECLCGRQQPGWTLGSPHWKNFLLFVSATATVTTYSALLLLQLFNPYSLTEPDSSCRVTPHLPSHPRAGTGSHTVLPSRGSHQTTVQPPWAWVWVAWEREEFMAFCSLSPLVCHEINRH